LELLHAAEEAIRQFGELSIELEVADLKDDAASTQRLVLTVSEAEHDRDMAVARYRLHQEAHAGER
jgi:hypothetical protein